MTDDESHRIREHAIKLLARREHSRAELKRKLTARAYPERGVDLVLDRLMKERLLDESRFTEVYVSGRAARGFGPVRIRAELAQRGVESAAVERVLGGAEIDWPASALAARRKKFGVAAAGDLRERARQTRYLEYRGFTHEQIRYALSGGDEPD